jgi:hypothetical protein
VTAKAGVSDIFEFILDNLTSTIFSLKTRHAREAEN